MWPRPMFPACPMWLTRHSRTALLVALLAVVCLFTGLAAGPASPAYASGLRGDFVVTPDGSYLAVSGYDRTRGADQLLVYTPAWGESTRQNQWGAEAVVDGGVITKLTAPGIGGDAPVPAGGDTLSGHGQAATWMGAHLRVGMRIELRKDAIMATSHTDTTTVTKVDPAPPWEFPGGRGPDELVVYTPAYSEATTGTNQYGVEAVAERAGSGYRVTAVGGNNSTIPANGIVLSGHGTMLAWIQQNVIPGTLLTLSDDTAGATLSATIDAMSYLYAGQLAVDAAQDRIDAARASFADAPLDRATGTLAQARGQLTQAGDKHEAGDDRGAIETADQAATTAVQAGELTAESDAVEARAVWHRPTETSPAAVDATVAAMASAGFNQLYLETFWGGQTIYPSAFTDQNPAFAGWDPLVAYVAAADRHGVHLHLWVHSFFIGFSGGDAGAGPVVRDHPEWLVKDRAGRVVSTTEPGYYFLDPAIPAARAWLLRVFTEAASRYDVPGVQLDYIRYPSQGSTSDQVSSYNDLARARFEERYGADPAQLHPGDTLYQTWLDWQTEQVTTFVREARAALPKGTILSSALETTDNAADVAKFHQDFASWVRARLLDVVVPEVYSVGTGDVHDRSADFVTQVGTNAFTSIGIAPSFLAAPAEASVWQVVAAREAGATGQAHFVWHSLDAEHQAALARSVYRRKAFDPQADPVGGAAAEVADMLRRVDGVYAAALQGDQDRLVATLTQLRRDLTAHQLPVAARHLAVVRHAVAGVDGPAPVRDHLRADVDLVQRILDTARPDGWPTGR
ncbi:family 10 glycosylhydrolase [Actinopolymorpha rutila]|uniref:Uncharacterized lipoprotein YddW (UPF0748 family) n=1 Tax=Actinopolymorpha rutila TaxID=446787 RepID=A0A852ZSE0_9ACTN|nr:family 10 glycosylhydrolase [Actinopolymorpha rutila]NYH91910.1 uncharacterized lipoprotein YddW (UPF0748 family) [Actinopolymorpha rutila]